MESEARDPWWLHPRIRMTILLGCLALAALGLVARKTDVLASGHHAPPGDAADACKHPTPPPLARVDGNGLLRLRRKLVPVIVASRDRTEFYGSTSPQDAWLDYGPSRFGRRGPYPAAYAITAWSPRRDYIGASAYRFADAGQARLFFGQATTMQCHADSAAGQVGIPHGARRVVWLNPRSYPQADVYVVRGRIVYRVIGIIGQVHGRLRMRTAQWREARRVGALACHLPGARCP